MPARIRSAAIAALIVVGMFGADTALAAKRFSVYFGSTAEQSFRPEGINGCATPGGCPGSVSGNLAPGPSRTPAKCIVGRRVAVYHGTGFLGEDRTDESGIYRVENPGIFDTNSHTIVALKRKFGPRGRRKVCIEQRLTIP